MSKKLLEKIEQLEKRIAELEGNKAKAVELPFWMPEDCKLFYFLNSDGEGAVRSYTHEDFSNNGHIAIGNYAKTKEILIKRRDKLKLLEEIKQWRGKHDPESFKFDWENRHSDKWELYYDHEEQEWSFTVKHTSQAALGIYLTVDADLDQFLEHFGDRLDLLLERDGE